MESDFAPALKLEIEKLPVSEGGKLVAVEGEVALLGDNYSVRSSRLGIVTVTTQGERACAWGKDILAVLRANGRDPLALAVLEVLSQLPPGCHAAELLNSGLFGER